MEKNKKNSYLFVSMTAILACFLLIYNLVCFPIKVSAEEVNYFSSEKTITDTKKSWIIRFNSQLNADTVNGENVYIFNNTLATKIQVEVQLSEDKKSIEIKPIYDYINGDSYTIYIKNSLKNDKFKNLKNTVALNFRLATNAGIQQVNSYVNSLFTCIKVKVSSKVFSVKIDGTDTQYDGDGIYSLNSLDIYKDKNVKIIAYDGNGNVIDTMDYCVK